MSTGDYIDLVAPRPPSPPQASRSRHQIVPFVVQLPDELLRQIFELAVLSNPHTARQLLRVSKWVYRWVVQLVYETLVVTTRGDVKRALSRSPRLLGYVRNVWVEIGYLHLAFPLALRLSGVTRLFVNLGGRNDLPQLLPFNSATQLRELYVNHYVYPLALPVDALTSLTHLRLSPFTSELAVQLSQPDTLPVLTHLAIDTFEWTYKDPGVPTFESDCKMVLSAPSRESLQVLVVVMFDCYDSYGENMLRFGLDRLFVLRGEGHHKRCKEWIAESKGEPGFWQRVKQFGVCALSAGARSEFASPCRNFLTLQD